MIVFDADERQVRKGHTVRFVASRRGMTLSASLSGGSRHRLPSIGPPGLVAGIADPGRTAEASYNGEVQHYATPNFRSSDSISS